MQEWERSDASYGTRIENLTGPTTRGKNGRYHLNGWTVFDDAFTDTLTGSAGLDWFFANLDSCDEQDQITDRDWKEAAKDLSR